MEKPDPVTLACETVTGDVEGFDSVSCMVLLPPTETVPKFKLPLETAILFVTVL